MHQHEQITELPTPATPAHQLEVLQAGRRFRNALKLNNIGVHLLERQCYHQAAQTLKAAADLMKEILTHTCATTSACKQKNGKRSLRDCISNNNGDDLVNAALLRLARPKAPRSRVMILNVLTRTAEGTLEVDGPQQETALESLLTDSLSSSIASPILFEADDDDDECESWNQSNNSTTNKQGNNMKISSIFSVKTAIIFHNLGLACLCQSRATKNKISSALQFSQFAYAILLKESMLSSTTSSSSSEQNDDEDHYEVQQNDFADGARHILMAVLNTLIHTLDESMEHDKALKLYETLVQLRSSDRTRKDSHGGTVRAAPAA